MDDFAATRLRPLAPGILLALLAIAFGFGMGAAFGANEDGLKGGLEASGRAVLESAYGGDEAEMNKVVSKSWSYYKRAHLHANALGTTALAATLLLALIGPPRLLERTAAGAFGAGALLYGLFWMLAGAMAPGLGSTGAAKDALEILAIPGAGLCIVGLALTLYAVITRVVLAKDAA